MWRGETCHVGRHPCYSEVMTDEPNNLVLEHLKKIQASLAEMRNTMADMRRDTRDVKASNAMILGMIGEMVKASARDEERFAGLEARLERLEHRFDLHE